MTLTYLRGNSLTASEIALRYPGHLMYIMPSEVSSLGLISLGQIPSIELCLWGKVVWNDVDCHTGRSHNRPKAITVVHGLALIMLVLVIGPKYIWFEYILFHFNFWKLHTKGLNYYSNFSFDPRVFKANCLSKSPITFRTTSIFAPVFNILSTYANRRMSLPFNLCKQMSLYLKFLLKKSISESVKPGSKSLLELIQGFLNLAYVCLSGKINKATWLLHNDIQLLVNHHSKNALLIEKSCTLPTKSDCKS